MNLKIQRNEASTDLIQDLLKVYTMTSGTPANASDRGFPLVRRRRMAVSRTGGINCGRADQYNPGSVGCDLVLRTVILPKKGCG